MQTISEERLNELMTLWEQGVGISNEEMSEIFAAARERNELEAQLAETEDSFVKAIGLHQTVVTERDALVKEGVKHYNEALTAQVARLSDAMLEIIALDPGDFMPKWRQIAEVAIAPTPEASLIEYRNGVLEEAALEILDPKYLSTFQAEHIHKIADAIRAMRTDQ